MLPNLQIHQIVAAGGNLEAKDEVRSTIQGYLTYKKIHPPRTLP